MIKSKCKDCPYWKEVEEINAKLRTRQEQVILREKKCLEREKRKV